MLAPHVYLASQLRHIDGIDLSPQHVETVCHTLRSVLAQPVASNDASAHQAV